MPDSDGSQDKHLDTLFELAETCQRISIREDFFQSVYPRVHALLPHDKFACGVVIAGKSMVAEHLNVNFPGDLLERLGYGTGKTCPFFAKWRVRIGHPICL